MFEIGFTEILLILGIALLVLGPEKLPGLARQVGRFAGRARSMARQFREQLDDEVLRHERDWQRPAPHHRAPSAATDSGDSGPAAESIHPAPGDPEPVLATIPVVTPDPAQDPATTNSTGTAAPVLQDSAPEHPAGVSSAAPLPQAGSGHDR